MTTQTATRGTLKQLGYHAGGQAVLFVEPNARWSAVSRGKTPEGQPTIVDVTFIGGVIEFSVDGKRIDRLGAAMKVWGIPA